MPMAGATIRKGIRFVENESAHEYRHVTAADAAAVAMSA